MLPYTSKGRELGLQNHQLHNHPELARAHEYDLVGVVVHVGSIDTGKYISMIALTAFISDGHRV